MSVNHNLLALDDAELNSILERPSEIHSFVEEREDRICSIGTDGVAIVSLTASADDDPLAFIRTAGGASADEAAWIGGYRETPEPWCEVDMGYGPASYYRNLFLKRVAPKLERITVPLFASICDMDLLEQEQIYPTGWLAPGRKECLINSFERYRSYVLRSTEQGLNLLVWCD